MCKQFNSSCNKNLLDSYYMLGRELDAENIVLTNVTQSLLN